MANLATRKFILKTLLSLPTPILRALSGGGVTYRAGATLDPRLQFLTAAAQRAPAMSTLSPEAARRASAEGLASMTGPTENGVRIESLTIPGPDGPISARSYRPVVQDPVLPVMVFAHFGGGVIGDLATSETFCTLLAKIVQTAVVSVDYRLAPEHRFPEGLDDVALAFGWVRDHADHFGGTPGRAALGGDSMGGNFTAVICQDLRAAGLPQPDLQLLIYPCTDAASESQSMTTHADAFPLSRATMDWFIGHYVGPGVSPTEIRLSPLRADSLRDLAPAVVITAGFDPLVDQGEAYAKRLKDAGVPVTYRCYDTLTHGFTAMTGVVPAADVACREIAGLVRLGVEGRFG